MANTRLDPRQKQAILNSLNGFIHESIQERIEKQLETIIITNTAIVGSGDPVFTYKGSIYSCKNIRRTTRRTNQLQPQLKPTMDEWIDDAGEVNVDMGYIKAFLASVLNASNNVSDYHRILPDCLHSVLRPFASLPNVQLPISDEQVIAIQQKNHKAVGLIKRRLLLNLIE